MSADRIRVVCVKENGRRVLFKEYAKDQLAQARIDVAALRSYGITADVEGELCEQLEAADNNGGAIEA